MPYQIDPFEYSNGNTPVGYSCLTCGVSGCKLWRMGASSCVELTCCDCAGRIEQEDVSGIDDKGKMEDRIYGRIDQIGSYVPAVPDEDGDSFWGYCSVPEPGCVWWRNLPTRKIDL